MSKLPDEPLTGLRKAAILLVLLGDEAAAAIYKVLPPEELRNVTMEIAELEYIAPEVAISILEEYQIGRAHV